MRKHLKKTNIQANSGLRENSLGRGNHALPARVDLSGLPQRPCKRLERGLDDMVAVSPAQLMDVQRHAGRVSQRLEEVLHQLRLILPNVLCWEVKITAEMRPP